jgi:hypothetical protein
MSFTSEAGHGRIAEKERSLLKVSPKRPDRKRESGQAVMKRYRAVKVTAPTNNYRN